ncbi:hypothetical protein [Hyphobacterium sp.]|uniref:hypothetical protein n=1 Tax=Hyphobacterium sp. TaxID=2004662 RepID=UPI003BA8E54D
MSQREKKTDGVEIRISPDRKSQLMRAATRDGKTASAVIRELIDGYLDPANEATARISRAPLYGLGLIIGLAVMFAALAFNPAQQAGADQLETDITVMIAPADDLMSRVMMDTRMSQPIGEPFTIQFTRNDRTRATVLQVLQPYYGQQNWQATAEGTIWLRAFVNEEPHSNNLAFTVQFVFVEAGTEDQLVLSEHVLRAQAGSLARLEAGAPDVGLVSIRLRPQLNGAERSARRSEPETGQPS